MNFNGDAILRDDLNIELLAWDEAYFPVTILTGFLMRAD